MALEPELKNKKVAELCQAFLKLKSQEECLRFLRDLCTFNEISSMSERYHLAILLNKNIPYRKIALKTGASTATITRVAQWLHHGMQGYKLVLGRLSK